MRHPTMDPKLISAGLGVEPKVSYCVGQERRRPDGVAIGNGIHAITYWSSFSKNGEDSDLLQVLDQDLSWLETKRAFIEDFLRQFARPPALKTNTILQRELSR